MKLAAPKLPGLADAAPEAYEHRLERVVRRCYVFTDKAGQQMKVYRTPEDCVEFEQSVERPQVDEAVINVIMSRTWRSGPWGLPRASTPRRRRKPSAGVAE